MQVIKDGTTIWGIDYIVNIIKLTPDKNGNSRYKFTIYFQNGDIVVETRRSSIDLTRQVNAMPTIEMMLKEYEMKEN